MTLDRRQFVGGSLASMMAVMLGVSPQEAQAAMQAAEATTGDDALVFLIDGTKEAPQITVQGVIRAASFDARMDFQDLMSDGVVIHQYLRESPTFTVQFQQPFTMRWVDEDKFWGVK